MIPYGQTVNPPYIDDFEEMCERRRAYTGAFIEANRARDGLLAKATEVAALGQSIALPTLPPADRDAWPYALDTPSPRGRVRAVGETFGSLVELVREMARDYDRRAAALRQIIGEIDAEFVLPEAFAGSLAGQMTPERINQVCGDLSHRIGRWVICAWTNHRDPEGFRGHHAFVLLDTDQPDGEHPDMYKIGADLLDWLTTPADDPDALPDPGSFSDWVGTPMGQLFPGRFGYHDGAHNYAHTTGA
ncbi:hypothetical protein ACWEKT_39915 [Nocardia takedensis]